MKKTIKPNQNNPEAKKKQVTHMFDGISKSYDLLNRIITLGVDIIWRKRVVKLIEKVDHESILDIATGTGDLAINLTRTNASQIIGLDISEGMLDVGRQKILKKELHNTIDMVVGDSENLPFDDDAFDTITVAFGVRNFENLEIGLAEILRVLKPGGIVVILETSVPTKFPFKQGYYLHTRVVLPLIGKLFSNDKSAYSYLSESASKFPYGTAFNNILTKTGFINTKALPQTFGVATIYTATKH